MAIRGPKPYSTVKTKLSGNAAHKRINTREPTPPPIAPSTLDTPPLEIANNAAARREWIRLAPMLRVARQITEADRAALLALCIEWSRYLEATRRAHPRILIASKSKYKMPNPWLSIQKSALAACLKLWPELGLTPSARSRVVQVPDAPPGGDNFSTFDTPLTDVPPIDRLDVTVLPRDDDDTIQ